MNKIKMLDEVGVEHLVDEVELVDRESAYGIYIKDGRVLLVQDKNSLTWEFPGGGVDEGESKEEAVVREFLEETGLKIDPSKIKFFKDIQDYFYSNTYKQAWNSLRYFYFVEVIGGEILEEGNGEDTVRVGYFSEDQIKDLKIKPKILQIVDENLK